MVIDSAEMTSLYLSYVETVRHCLERGGNLKKNDAFVHSFCKKVFLLPRYADTHYKMTIFYLCIHHIESNWVSGRRSQTKNIWVNSLSAKSILAGEKLVATYSIST
jgi:hypothetical protein